MDTKFYTYFIPTVGLVVPIAIILSGAVLYGPKKIKGPNKVSKVLLSPPWWMWIIAIMCYSPFIIHTLELWHPHISHTREIVDIAFMVTVFFYFILCLVIAYKHERKKIDGYAWLKAIRKYSSSFYWRSFWF